MNIIRNRIAVCLCIFLFVPPGATLALFADKDKNVIWRDSANVFFKYASQRDAAFGRNEHPVTLQPEDIVAVVKSLRLGGREGGSQAVFSPQQSQLLGRYLAQGLRNAKPDQDIVFAMEKAGDRTLLFTPPELFVAGRAFYQDDRLNIIIGDYDRPRDEAYESAYDPTRVGIVQYDFDHGRRERASRAFTKTVVGASGVENKLLNGSRRADWLVIDLQAATTAAEQPRGLPAATVPAAPGAAPSAPRPAGISWRDLEEGLKTLNRLREQGLITDQEYEAKKRQMLDALGPW